MVWRVDEKRQQWRQRATPGRAHRDGISLLELADMFPTEEAARTWFEATLWPTERCCGHCGAMSTSPFPNERPMPYWCPDCRSYFSVQTGTALASSKVPLRKWAFAIYLHMTNPKGISSMKLHRDLGVSQPTAWFMLHRIREAWAVEPPQFKGPVEVDETYVGDVDEFAGRYSLRDADTIRQMEAVVAGLVGRRRLFRDLTAK